MKAIYKVPGGKLLKIFLSEENGVIKDIKITGDFFMYPEEGIELLEKKLTGMRRSADSLKTAVDAFFDEAKPRLFGIDADSIITTIMNAV